MTAREAEVAAASAAVDLGQLVSQAYYEAAGASPGVGLQVSLLSVADSLGRLPQGEGFDVPPSAPALRPVQRPRLVPQYGSEPLGGSGFIHNGVSWPSPMAPAQLGRSSSRSSIVHVSPRSADRVGTAVPTSERAPGPTSASSKVIPAGITSPSGPVATPRRGRLRRAFEVLFGRR